MLVSPTIEENKMAAIQYMYHTCYTYCASPLNISDHVCCESDFFIHTNIETVRLSQLATFYDFRYMLRLPIHPITSKYVLWVIGG